MASRAALAASAQTVTGTLQGTVSDSTGARLPGAQVVIRNVETGARRDVLTTELGFYAAPFLPISRYTVTVALDGFATAVREGIDVGLNQTRVADFEMRPSTLAETITVQGAAPPNQHQQRRGEEHADGRTDHRQADAQSRQLPVAGRDLPRLPGRPDLRADDPTASSGSSHLHPRPSPAPTSGGAISTSSCRTATT